MTEILNLMNMLFVSNIKIRKYKENESETVGFLAHVNLQIMELQKERNERLERQYIDTKRSIIALRKKISNEHCEENNLYQKTYNTIMSLITKLSNDELSELKNFLDNEVLKLNEYIDIINGSSEDIVLHCYLLFYGDSKKLPNDGEDYKLELLSDIKCKRDIFSNTSKYIEGITLARGNQKK